MKPRYQQLKQYVSEQIDSGALAEGERVASDNELATHFGVSRMTANRALRELTSEGVLVRVSGVGTFVAAQVPQVPLIEIKNIADEIRSRGHEYSVELLSLEAVAATEEVAARLGLATGEAVFHSLLVHRENNIPVQLEERWVNPAAAPGYLAQDFSTRTPYEYLMAMAPLSEAEHIIEAVLPNETISRQLDMDNKQACLLVHRRTWCDERCVSAADLYHPGKRYRMGGRFSPNRNPTG